MTHIPGIHTRDEIVRRLADALSVLRNHQRMVDEIEQSLHHATWVRDDAQTKVDTLYAELAGVMRAPDEQP